MLHRHIHLLFQRSNFLSLNKNYRLIGCNYHNSSQFWCASKVEEGSSSEENERVEEAVGYAYNTVEKKKGLYKPKHTLEEQIAYMNSKDTYKGMPVYHSYRRNFKGQAIFMPKPRMFCIDKEGRFKVNHACPICRDEYLFFDYRNPALILQFLFDQTDRILPLKKLGLCFDQYAQLRAQLLKAKEHGFIKFAVPFQNFNYKKWYPWWDKEDDHVYVRREVPVDEIHKQPLVNFPVHNRDYNNDWDQYWLRYDEFIQRSK
ncbi:LP10852p, putative [Brugia malayi]|uniref:Small ribosomal subunit protein mS40 n=1 Tax=Brugia malayi TaxID=6279 RepID=A0A1P6C6L6_BRUMA|nr:LP10852p, putative [Brugia malayi]CDQ05276.1 BMA-MRPS-18B, isoform c [Brugia malayi]VIO88407.1 LP10852p, putative [Brugia malayi]